MLRLGARSRALAAGASLILMLAACEINVELVTTVDRDGGGRFSLRFLVDKELVDLARAAGEDPFQALECPASLADAGWECGRTTEDGGLVITLERAFENHDGFNRAMEELERLAAEQEGPTAQFFTLRIERDPGFLRTKTAVRGSIDLTSTGALGNVSEESRRTLETIIEQAAGEFFTFRLAAELPGRITRTIGDPERVEGGTATWNPRLGGELTFLAESSAYNGGALALLGVAGAAILALLAWAVRRRGRRGSRGDDAPAPAAPSERAQAPPV